MSLFLKSILGLSLFIFCSCSSIDGWLGKTAGRADARKDLQAGKLRLETMLPPPPPMAWDVNYKWLLKKRYGIEHRVVAGCVVSDRVLGHADGYNEIMEAEIARRFGKDVLKKTADEAREKTPSMTP